MSNQNHNILAIEVGSSRVKVGWFPSAGACASEKPAANLPIVAAPRTLPEPSAVFRAEHRRDEAEWTGEVAARLSELLLPEGTICIVAAVHRAAAESLQSRVLKRQSLSQVIKLTRSDVSVEANVNEPSRIGIDRLLNALAANHIRQAGRPAIVVDVGTAMTVNLISADGVFQGGAILAGPMTALRALHSATSSLPLLGRDVLEAAPAPVGKSTEHAMAAGAYWGAIGAARELIARTATACRQSPEVFLTGGASAGLAPHIGFGEEPARHIPDLILSGIRLAAEGILAR
ncbi:MAG TPA: type III pantothenate kinase [Lacipirellula sp.]